MVFKSTQKFSLAENSGWQQCGLSVSNHRDPPRASHNVAVDHLKIQGDAVTYPTR